MRSATEDGYEFVERLDRYYTYAKLDKRGDFAPRELRVGIDDPEKNAVVKGLRRSSQRRRELQESLELSESDGTRAAGKRAAAQALPSTITMGIVLLEFNDIKGSSYTEDDYEDMFFSSNYTGTSHPDGQQVFGSIAEYWEQMSGGTVTVTDSAVGSGPAGGILNPVVSGAPSWVPLAEDKLDYHTTYSMGQFRAAARAAAKNMGINTTTSSTYRIAYVYAGNLHDQSYPGGCGSCGLTPHASSIGGTEYTYSEVRDANHATDARNCEAPSCATTPVFVHIGTHVHETLRAILG